MLVDLFSGGTPCPAIDDENNQKETQSGAQTPTVVHTHITHLLGHRIYAQGRTRAEKMPHMKNPIANKIKDYEHQLTTTKKQASFRQAD